MKQVARSEAQIKAERKYAAKRTRVQQGVVFSSAEDREYLRNLASTNGVTMGELFLTCAKFAKESGKIK